MGSIMTRERCNPVKCGVTRQEKTSLSQRVTSHIGFHECSSHSKVT